MRTKNAVIISALIAAVMSVAVTSCNTDKESSTSDSQAKSTTATTTTTTIVTTVAQTDKPQTTTSVSHKSVKEPVEAEGVVTIDQEIIIDTNDEVTLVREKITAPVMTPTPTVTGPLLEDQNNDESQEDEERNKVIELPVIPLD